MTTRVSASPGASLSQLESGVECAVYERTVRLAVKDDQVVQLRTG